MTDIGLRKSRVADAGKAIPQRRRPTRHLGHDVLRSTKTKSRGDDPRIQRFNLK
jgi:hypothetical protein